MLTSGDSEDAEGMSKMLEEKDKEIEELTVRELPRASYADVC